MSLRYFYNFDSLFARLNSHYRHGKEKEVQKDESL